MIYSVYRGARILRVEYTDELVLSDGEQALEGAFPPNEYYMVGELPMPRPEFNLSYSVAIDGEGVFNLPSQDSVFRIDGVPSGTEIVDPSGHFIENDGWYESSFRSAGKYLIALSLFPYKEAEVHVAT